MNVTFQYPIFDCRTLFEFNETIGHATIGNSRYKLSDIQFLNNTGSSSYINSKNKIQSPQPHFFFARKAMKLPDLSCAEFACGNIKFTPQVSYRIFVPVKDFISYYEVVFFNKYKNIITYKDTDLLKSIISHYRKIALTIPLNFKEKGDSILQHPQSCLSDLFFHSTTPESYARVVRNIIKGEVKKDDYEAYDDYMHKNIKTGTPIAVFEIISSGKLDHPFNEICSFDRENINIYCWKIKDRINIWIIARQNEGQYIDLVSEIKMYILSTHRLNQSIKNILKFINTNTNYIHNKTTRVKILESITDNIIADRYFNTKNGYDIQQLSIRDSILSLNEAEAKELITEIDKLDKLKLTLKTLYLLYNKDFLSNILNTHIVHNLGYKNIAWFQQFKDEIVKGNYKECLKLTKIHRELATTLIGLIKKIAIPTP